MGTRQRIKILGGAALVAVIACSIMAFFWLRARIGYERIVITQRETKPTSIESATSSSALPLAATSSIAQATSTLQTSSTNSETPPVIKPMSNSLRNALQKFFPPTLTVSEQIYATSSTYVILVKEPDRAGRQVWVVDLKQGITRKIGVREEICADATATSWAHGVAVNLTWSPCEAGSVNTLTYLNEKQEVAADVVFGNLHGKVDGHIGAQVISAEVVQDEACGGQGMWEDASITPAPQVTVSNIRVNGALVRMPKPILVSCQYGYGGVFWDYYIPEAWFDGERIVFDLPGYRVKISASGAAIFEQAP